MSLFLSKLLPRLVYPLGLTTGLLLVAFFFGLVGPQAFGCGFFIAGAVHSLVQFDAGDGVLVGRFAGAAVFAGAGCAVTCGRCHCGAGRWGCCTKFVMPWESKCLKQHHQKE